MMNNIATTDCLKLSVIVLTYNQENTIAQTLDSILQQKHNYSYEIVIGEDCSTDKTREMLLEYQLRYPDVIRLLLNEKNLGLIGNYFNVIEHCRGEYIMQCAGDDWWLPGKVALQIPYMDNHPECGMCYTDAACIYENKHNKGSAFIRGRYDNSLPSLLEENPVAALTISIRRAVLMEYINEIQPKEKDWKTEDYPIWLWLSSYSKIEYIPQVTSCYRISSGTASRAKQYVADLHFLLSVAKIKRFFYDRHSKMLSLYIQHLINAEIASIQLQIGYITHDTVMCNFNRKLLLRNWTVKMGWRKALIYLGLIICPPLTISVRQYRYSQLNR